MDTPTEIKPERLFRLELKPVAEDGAAFNTHLPPPPEVLNSEWVSNLYFEAGLIGVVHGRIANRNAPGSLLILNFDFVNENADRNHCFKEAAITIRFAAKRSEPANPLIPDNLQVLDVSPNGVFAVNPASWDSQTIIHLGPEVSVGPPAPMTLGVNAYLEKVSTVQIVDRAKVTGKPVVHWKDSGNVRRAAWFTMHENPKTLGGVPSTVRVAILLQRNPGDEGFVFLPEINLRVGTLQYVKRKIWRFFGFLPEVESTVFDATKPSTLVVEGLCPDRLEEFDLDRLSDVVSETVINGIRSQGDPEGGPAKMHGVVA